jgi:hypothetical protein
MQKEKPVSIVKAKVVLEEQVNLPSGRWSLFSFAYEHSGKEYESYIYARSQEEAVSMLVSIKANARIIGEVLSVPDTTSKVTSGMRSATAKHELRKILT